MWEKQTVYPGRLKLFRDFYAVLFIVEQPVHSDIINIHEFHVQLF